MNAIWQYVVTLFHPGRKHETGNNLSLKAMHGINKISILLFVIGMIYFIAKKF